MPKLWNDTIEAHRSQVREAICDATATLVRERGLRGVTMAQVAETTGIGRATLYKYFSDVEAILHFWHARHIDQHLTELSDARDAADGPRARLAAVLTAFGVIAFRTKNAHGEEVMGLLHRDDKVATAHAHVRSLVASLIDDAAHASVVRNDVDVEEMTTYCLHAVAGAAALDSDEAVHRLVRMTLAGIVTT